VGSLSLQSSGARHQPHSSDKHIPVIFQARRFQKGRQPQYHRFVRIVVSSTFEGLSAYPEALGMQLEQPSSIDLEALDLDPAPIFVIRVSTTALKFDILYANQAFRISKLRDAILADDRGALLFRSWAQALGPDRTPQSGFSGWTWSAELAKGGALKTIRAAEPITRQRSSKEDNKLDDLFKPPAETLLPIWPTIGQNRSSSFQGSNTLRNLPRTNLSARWKGIQAMMEMSDVGVFEYNTAGKLLHGNEAWYKLR
jgi:hypothetical protein